MEKLKLTGVSKKETDHAIYEQLMSIPLGTKVPFFLNLFKNGPMDHHLPPDVRTNFVFTIHASFFVQRERRGG